MAKPIAIRRFAGALGILAKTDQLDSRVIAHYAATLQPPVRALPEGVVEAFLDRRIGQVEPMLQEMNAQHIRQAGSIARRCIRGTWIAPD